MSGSIKQLAEFEKIVDEYNAENKQIEKEMTKADALERSELEAKMQKLNKKMKDKIPIPKGSSVDVHDYSLGKIYNNNPLTKGLTKTIIREGSGDKVKDKIRSTFVDSYGKATGYVDATKDGFIFKYPPLDEETGNILSEFTGTSRFVNVNFKVKLNRTFSYQR